MEREFEIGDRVVYVGKREKFFGLNATISLINGKYIAIKFDYNKSGGKFYTFAENIRHLNKILTVKEWKAVQKY